MKYFLFLLLFSQVLHAQIHWEKDYKQACMLAQNENKPLLIFFTGSDWSGWSMKMKKEILQSEDFIKKIGSKFICVEIDFPDNKSLISKENQLLKESLNVHDYPRLILLESNQREIARFGFSAEKADQFADEIVLTMERDEKLSRALTHLDDSIVSTDLRELYHLAVQLKRGSDAKRILNVGVLRGNLTFLLEKYRVLVEKGRGKEVEALSLRERLDAADPENRLGIPFALCLIDFQNNATLSHMTAAESVKPLERYLERFGAADVQNCWRLEMMVAQVYLNEDEWQSALKHAESAYQLAPKERQEEIAHSLNYIRSEAKIAAN